MCNDKETKSFVESKALRDIALDSLERMKEIEKNRESQLTTIVYPNGTIVKTSNKELIEFYNNKYGNKL